MSQIYRNSEPNNQPKPKKRGVFGKIFRGYLMLAGAAFTIYWLIRLVVWALVYFGITDVSWGIF